MSVERHSECSEHVRSPMVFVDSATALAESQNNSAEFYASLPREKSLLCCVCQKHNTTFRYEVIYKSGPALGHKQPVNNNNSGKFYCFSFVPCSTWGLFSWQCLQLKLSQQECLLWNFLFEDTIISEWKVSFTKSSRSATKGKFILLLSNFHWHHLHTFWQPVCEKWWFSNWTTSCYKY